MTSTLTSLSLLLFVVVLFSVTRSAPINDIVRDHKCLHRRWKGCIGEATPKPPVDGSVKDKGSYYFYFSSSLPSYLS